MGTCIYYLKLLNHLNIQIYLIIYYYLFSVCELFEVNKFTHLIIHTPSSSPVNVCLCQVLVHVAHAAAAVGRDLPVEQQR